MSDQFLFVGGVCDGELRAALAGVSVVTDEDFDDGLDFVMAVQPPRVEIVNARTHEQLQALWDQLLARAIIEETYFSMPFGCYTRITGADVPLDGAIARVPPLYHVKTSVRPFVAAQWPKLSNWLWTIPGRTKRTHEFEDRLVRLISTREWKAGVRQGYVDPEAYGALRREQNRMRAERLAYGVSAERMKHSSNWHVTKAVRSK